MTAEYATRRTDLEFAQCPFVAVQGMGRRVKISTYPDPRRMFDPRRRAYQQPGDESGRHPGLGGDARAEPHQVHV